MPRITVPNVADSVVQRAQAGDERALHELFVRHRDDVAAVIFRILGPDSDLEDVLQEAFIQVFRSIGRFEGASKFTTWLYRVVTNVARMHIRKLHTRPRTVSESVSGQPFLADPAHAPDMHVARHARLRALYRHLNQLTDKKRTVLVLHDIEGLSPQEIAEIIETPIQTVRTRLFYGRRQLYAALATDPELADIAETLDRVSISYAQVGKETP